MPEVQSVIAQEMLGLSRVRIEHPTLNKENLTVAAQFDRASLETDGMLKPGTESKELMNLRELAQWIAGEDGPLWWIRTQQESDPIGFVFSYKDEHVGRVRRELAFSQLGISPSGRIKEMSSFITGDQDIEEIDGVVQAASELFRQNATDIITMYVTHNEETTLLDPQEVERLQGIGFKQLFTFRYPEDDTVDTTCFVIDKAGLASALQRRVTTE